jgi:beta-glucanase (GH16 family)
MRNNFIKSLFIGLLMTASFAAPDLWAATTGQWTFCANENGQCVFTGTQTVRYGAGSSFVSKSLSWNAACNNNTFGDPAPGKAKHCEVTSSWGYCADENGQCAFSDTETVRYGANNTYFTRTSTGGTACNSSTFGGDPVPGTAKHCDRAATTWTLCANEGGQCAFSGTNIVLYGANGSYTTKTLTGGAACNNTTFGDPAPGVAKHCYLPGVPIADAGGSTGPAGYTLVWSDEFNGTSVDTSKWNFEVNSSGGGNNELQYYTSRSQNVRVENGHLVIEARQENYTGADGITRNYTSGRINSANKGDWTYGRMEASIKLPYGQGLWPAFWMLPTDNAYGTWAASGEIDMMEAVNLKAAGGNNIYGSIQYGGAWPNNAHTTVAMAPSTSVADNYHVYAVEWEPTQMRWYVDNVLYSTQTSWWSSGGAFPAPFDKRFHLLFNVAVGGSWPGNPDGTTVFPQQMLVDYVRVYRKN